MESILISMGDETLEGKISIATKTVANDDSFPVMRPYPQSLSQPIDYAGWSGLTIEHMRQQHMLIPQIPQIPQIKRKYEDADPSDDEMHRRIHKLLDSGRFRKGMSRANALEAINLIETSQTLGFDIVCRGLVYFPDILNRYLIVHHSGVSEDDLGAMMARCIQHMPEDTFQMESVGALLNYIDGLNIPHTGMVEIPPLEIKLLPGKYPIDSQLYDMVRTYNIRDSYYDSAMAGEPYIYTLPDLVSKERTKKYVGYRDAYHCLLYGTRAHLQALIVRWDLWGDDCTADAARDFFGLDSGVPIEAVMARVNNKCAGLKM